MRPDIHQIDALSGVSEMRLLDITFTADGFLRHMVRRLVGYLVEESMHINEHDTNMSQVDRQLWCTQLVNRIFEFDTDADKVREYAEKNIGIRIGEKEEGEQQKKSKKAPPRGLWLLG